ncbi:hypothetical protein CAL26_05130 [Bordetella genomosp. 9]|uniref:Portal protein n=1 Tax=Bordetella genomosp. 9 TaxID=1416803 RepID=A0A261RNS9_9BORD|nr:hypothetical protein [Bordetella genomosp. 9]OZI26706.1 hypothetical protein CAL26_05130 [Bordetella genomosp. 9]
MPKLSDEEFHKILDSQINEAASWQEEHLKDDRDRNYRYYLGWAEPAPAGRSQAVSWDVYETVESALPDLIEIFLSGDNVAEYEPVGQEDEAYAQQATDYINYIFLKQNPGFLIMNTWIKDALLSKMGIVRAYWATCEKVTRKDYTGIDEDQLTQLLADPDAEVDEQSTQDDPQDVAAREQAAQVLNTLAPEMRGQVEAYLASPVRQLYDVTIKTTRKKGRVYIDNVQPENFIVTPRAKNIGAADIVGEMKYMSRSDMLEAGYKKSDVMKVQSFDTILSEDGGIAQTANDETESNRDTQEWPDKATEEVLVFDGFIRLDYDGDGIAEWRRVVRGGNLTLANDDAEDHDFVVMSPILIPHRLVGMALADPVVPIQQSSTAMQRQYIDSLMLANNPRTYVNTQAGVNLDDLLNNRIGGIVRGQQPMQNAISPLVTTNVADSALQGIEFMDSRREARTGITRYNQGLDADSLNKTATGVSKIMTAGDRRKLMMARIMAETGVKDLFRLLLRLVTENQDKPATIKLRNQWVQMDPTGWSPEMDVTIETGLGSGDKSQMVAILNQVLTIQQTAIGAQAPVVTMKNVYNTLAQLVKVAGLKYVDKYFTDPGDAPAQPPQGQSDQDPNATALAQAQVQSAQIQLQGKQMQVQADREARQLEFQIEQVKLQQAQVQLEIAKAKLGLEQAEAGSKAALASREQDRKDLETVANLSRPEVPHGAQ